MAARADASAMSLKKFGIGAAVAFGVVAIESLKAASKFQQSTELIHTQAGVSQASVDSMRKSILGLSGEVGTGPEALSEAMFHIASTGARGAKAIAELKTAAEGAKVGNADLTDVTNALNATIVSGIKGAQNFGHAMGALNAIVGAGDMHMQDLADALGSGLLVQMKTFGVNLTQTGAALAVFGDNNIRGAQAATYLRQAVQNLSDPAQKADKALGLIHLTVGQLQTALADHGLSGALRTLHDHFETSGIAANRWGQVLEEAFTKKAGTGISILVEQFGRYELKQAEVAEGAKNFSGDWEATTKNLSFQFSRLQADVQVLAIKFGDMLIPAAMDTIHAFIAVGDAVAATVKWLSNGSDAANAVVAVLAAALTPAAANLALMLGGSLNRALGGMIESAIAGAAAMSGLAAAEDSAAASSAALDATNPAVAAFAVVVGALTFSWLHNREAAQKAKEAVDAYVTSLHTNTNSVASLKEGIQGLSGQMDALNAYNDKLNAAAPSSLQNVVKNSAAYSETTQKLALYRQELITVTDHETRIAQAYGLTRTQVQQLADANNIDLLGSLTSVDNGFKNLVASADLSKSPLKDANSNFEQMASATTTASQGVTALGNSFDDLVGNFVGMKQAQIDFKNDLISTVDALRKSNGQIGLGSKASRDAGSAYFSLVGKIKDVTTATYTSSKSYATAQDAAKKMLGALEGLNVSGPTVSRVIRGLKKDINGMGDAAFGAGQNLGAQLDAGIIKGLNFGSDNVNTNARRVVSSLIHNAYAEAAVKSPSQKMDYLGRMLAQGLISGWTGQAASIKNLLSTTTQNALNNLDSMLSQWSTAQRQKWKAVISSQQQVVKQGAQQLQADLATRRSDIAGVSSGVASAADLSNLFGTDANGNPTVANIGQFLGGQVGPLQQFAKDMQWGAAHHLAPILLQQIAALGALQGDQVLRQFMSGQASIAQANQAEAQIQAASGSVGVTVTDTNRKLVEAIKDDRLALEWARKTLHHDQEITHDVLKGIQKTVDRIERKAARTTAQHVTLEIKNGKLKIDHEDAKIIAAALTHLAHDTGIKVP